MIGAVILAAGNGSRMQMNERKQFMIVESKPLVAWSIEAFQNCAEIDEVVVVTNKECIAFCDKEIVKRYEYKKARKVVEGGATRGESVLNGLLANQCEYVLIHDGARPLITTEDISRCVKEVKEKKAVCMAVPVKDTIKVVDVNRVISNTPNRDCLWVAQTPQAFKHSIILEAYLRAKEDGFESTDDCSVVERLGVDVSVIMGSYDNIKITTKEDIDYCTLIMQKH